ncbi:GNAT family N-acetyltransferase [Streptomyces sp. ST2-7A]|uniref:GNAT family N-acetyltransferase n=1 Tax=Streptomyces sp. ST2-7A TaxID=2907214 RepID=UPI001F325E6F|nr:GNAT family N-acetyltransferase [Streptomyces sp. ST2-7A]MCE7079740.1 GNAT family N-acetyltransferase [Streptomyces sp. ST2-7A]
MTVTLRPREPGRTTPAGGIRHSFLLCDNGRPIGELTLSADGGTPRRGRIDHLWVAEPERRRGRGGIALLAAEEVLRSRGCDRVWALFPIPSGASGDTEGAVAAAGLAEAFGYRPLGVLLRAASSEGVARERGETDGEGTPPDGTAVDVPLGPGLAPARLRIVDGASGGAEAWFRAPLAGEAGGPCGTEVLDAVEEAVRRAGAVSLAVCTGPGRSPDEVECRERGYLPGHRVVGKRLG